MANTTLNPTIIAKTAVRILENELVFAKNVYRGYEDEISGAVNGYEKGGTITIRKPTDFTVRTGSVASAQDVVEGKETFTVDTVKGVDFKFTSQQLTLNIGELSERVIRPAMIQLANAIDQDVASLYNGVYNWAGTPGQDVNSFADFVEAQKRLDLLGVPQERIAVLSPTDHWALAASQTALYLQAVGQPAYRNGSIGVIGGVETFMSQNVQVHTCGSRTNTTPVTGATSLTTTWASAKDTEAVPGTQDITVTGAGNAVTIKQGDVFTIAGIYAVNPVTKATLPFLQPFVVNADKTTASDGTVTINISPAIITSGPKQTVSAAPTTGLTMTWFGAASTGYPQNLVFHKNAFGLVVVPLVKPPGAVDVARESYKGLSVRVVPVYDGINDVSMWRLDVLYGKKVLDARLATRLSGTA